MPQALARRPARVTAQAGLLTGGLVGRLAGQRGTRTICSFPSSSKTSCAHAAQPQRQAQAQARGRRVPLPQARAACAVLRWGRSRGPHRVLEPALAPLGQDVARGPGQLQRAGVQRRGAAAHAASGRRPSAPAEPPAYRSAAGAVAGPGGWLAQAARGPAALLVGRRSPPLPGPCLLAALPGPAWAPAGPGTAACRSLARAPALAQAPPPCPAGALTVSGTGPGSGPAAWYGPPIAKGCAGGLVPALAARPAQERAKKPQARALARENGHTCCPCFALSTEPAGVSLGRLRWLHRAHSRVEAGADRGGLRHGLGRLPGAGLEGPGRLPHLMHHPRSLAGDSATLSAARRQLWPPLRQRAARRLQAEQRPRRLPGLPACRHALLKRQPIDSEALVAAAQALTGAGAGAGQHRRMGRARAQGGRPRASRSQRSPRGHVDPVQDHTACCPGRQDAAPGDGHLPDRFPRRSQVGLSSGGGRSSLLGTALLASGPGMRGTLNPT